MMPGLLLALGGALRRGLGAAELMKKAHPEEPHWYLAMIGTIRRCGARDSARR